MSPDTTLPHSIERGADAGPRVGSWVVGGGGGVGCGVDGGFGDELFMLVGSDVVDVVGATVGDLAVEH